MSETSETIDVGPGQVVYDEDGDALGTVRGFDEHVSTGAAGEAELMWRCWECGEMGEIDGIPDTCPACGAEREAIYYWIED
jgi:ABC-type ATPase with predicted acetyltransferase domain